MSLTEDEREELMAFRRGALLALMRDISEDCWASGWNLGLEAALYRIAFEGASPEYGMGEISLLDRDQLKSLAARANCWFRWSDEARNSIPISLEEARTRYRYVQPLDPGVSRTVQEIVDLYEGSQLSDWVRMIETDEGEDVSSKLLDWLYRAREVYGYRHDMQVCLIRRHDLKFDLRYGDCDVRIVEPSWASAQFPRAHDCTQDNPCTKIRRCVACAEHGCA